MTIKTSISLAGLKEVKNAVIGNPSAKSQYAQDTHFVPILLDSLNSHDDIRVEAAHVISSLSYGSPQALSTLLAAGAHHAILYAISRLEPTDSLLLRAAFARALRAVTVSIADVVGPSQWGLSPDYSNDLVQNDAKRALDVIFHTDSLDIYLPLLSSTTNASSTSTSTLHPPTSISIYIAQLIASGVRTDAHRTQVSEWLPPSERAKEATRTNGSRRWEKTAVTNSNSPSRYGGWAALALAGLMTTTRDIKLQEAALSALAALAKDNPQVAVPLTKTLPAKDGPCSPSVLSTVLQLSKSKHIQVKLDACLCATHICRASSPASPSLLSPDSYDSCEYTIMDILNRMLNVQADEYATPHRTRACFILYYLVHDESSLCLAAFERGCLVSLATLVREITPPEVVEEWGQDEAISLALLREAALTLIASLALLCPEIRRCVTDELNLLPFINSSLHHTYYGVRYAACQCIRALSRLVQALRTNLVDSGVGMAVLDIIMTARESPEAGMTAVEAEAYDRRVLSAALAVICNCVNDFSPLRGVYLAHGLLPRLVQFVRADDDLRRDSLWAIKNLLTKTSVEEKREIMAVLQWEKLIELFDHPDPRIQEQAFNIVRNLSENEEGIDLCFSEIGIDILLDRLRAALESNDDDVTLQASLALANLVNSSEPNYTTRISNFPRLLSILHNCLTDRKTDIRRPISSIIYELARAGGPDGRKALADEGFGNTLRKIVEWAGPLPTPVAPPLTLSTSGSSGTSASPTQTTAARQSTSPSRSSGSSYTLSPAGLRPARYHRVEEDKKLTDLARVALDWLEHGDVYSVQ